MKTYGPTMHCNSKTLDYVCQIFIMYMSGNNSCPQPNPKSPPINRLINDYQSDVASSY